MPVTRSSSRSAIRSTPVVLREANDKAPAQVASSKSRKKPLKAQTVQYSQSQPSGQPDNTTLEDSPGDAVRAITPGLVPPVLSFSFENAKQHLIGTDARFADVFEKMHCRPFQQLQSISPFRALVESILGQQISWMAARSVNHKFKRLYNPSLPENLADYTPLMSASYFPDPQDVANSDIATLKTAGLSTRKAEYVKDLASRFGDGRLSTEKLIAANDEELGEMLTAVRGIGRWTVDMFAIFSLRRPDILPVGDLGVQRGLIRWFLSLHSPSYPIILSPKKLIGQSDQEKQDFVIGRNHKADDDVLPIPGQDDDNFKAPETESALAPDTSSVPPAAGVVTPRQQGELPSMPTPFTPSIDRTLKSDAQGNDRKAPKPLPDGLSVAILKSRLDGKKKIKGALLTPQEMEDLTNSWRPYRSIGVYYMWSLAEQK